MSLKASRYAKVTLLLVASAIAWATSCTSSTPKASRDGDAGVLSDASDACVGTDTSSDFSSCGACGHVCSPTVLVGGLHHQNAVAVDTTNAFWTNGGDYYNSGSIASAPIDGGPAVILADKQNFPAYIAIDGANVYWVNTGSPDGTPGSATLMKVSRSGGAPTLLASAGYASGIAVDAHSVYWVDSSAGTVMKVPIDGGTPITLASNQASPTSIAVDATSVYWTMQGGPPADAASGTVMKMPVSGGAAVELAGSVYYPDSIALDGGYVYWTVPSPGTPPGSPGFIQRVPVDGGTPEVVATGGEIFGFVIHDGTVYFGAQDGSLVSTLAAGGSPVTLAKQAFAAYLLAVGRRGVYWMEYGTLTEGTLMTTGTCLNGVCGCAGNRSECGGACRDLSTDREHCGSCDTRCADGSACNSGSCECPNGQSVCSDKCVDTSSDYQNCGACGSPCEGGACRNGVCGG